MYKIIKIKYKSVIVTDGQKESVTIQANGSMHEKGEQTFVYFENEDIFLLKLLSIKNENIFL